MKINANCGATSAAGSWSEPMRGSDNSAACWCVMSICSPLTMPSSTSPASGLLSGGIFETRSSKEQRLERYWGSHNGKQNFKEKSSYKSNPEERRKDGEKEPQEKRHREGT